METQLEDPTELDFLAELRRSCVCNRQMAVHVGVMVLAGLVYLGVGGIAGYYIGKACEYVSLLVWWLGVEPC